MFKKLFAESGLSLDRLKTLLEVGVAGSIVKAADGEPVRQSQYSRQIKELEEFFRVKLVERQGKGVRLTSRGTELARICRFFMMGLSNFQRGCLAEEQTFRIGASATAIRQFLLPALAGSSPRGGASYATEVQGDRDIERRLHDLTLDFGVVGSASLSRPLQTKVLGKWRLELWVPRAMGLNEAAVRREFEAQGLPLALARSELESPTVGALAKYPAQLECDNFLEVRKALEGWELAALLPDFLMEDGAAKDYLRVKVPEVVGKVFQFYLAWNPRLLRLNSHAGRRRDLLAGWLTKRMAGR